jgi:hypothetical protein
MTFHQTETPHYNIERRRYDVGSAIMIVEAIAEAIICLAIAVMFVGI